MAPDEVERIDCPVAILHFRLGCMWFSEKEELLGMSLRLRDQARFADGFTKSLAEGAIDGRCFRAWSLPESIESAFHKTIETGVAAARDRVAVIADVIEEQLNDVRQKRKLRLEQYYDGLKQEQEEESRSVYFHLYYFEREEKIKKRMENFRRERAEALANDHGLFAVNRWAKLVSVGIVLVPVWRFVKAGRSYDLEGLTGSPVGISG